MNVYCSICLFCQGKTHEHMNDEILSSNPLVSECRHHVSIFRFGREGQEGQQGVPRTREIQVHMCLIYASRSTIGLGGWDRAIHAYARAAKPMNEQARG